MQLLIPYNKADIHISTMPNGDLVLTIPDDTDLNQNILYQLFNVLSA